jgi:hypothetical protein
MAFWFKNERCTFLWTWGPGINHNDYFMRQCSLFKTKGETVTKLVAWLPESDVKVNKTIKLKDEDGWWCVETVGDLRVPYSKINERSQDYKHQRSASDI